MNNPLLALDSASLGATLCQLSLTNRLSPANWQPAEGENSERQQRLLDEFAADWPLYEQLPDQWAMISSDHRKLDNFYTARGLSPCFRPVRPGGLGIATAFALSLDWGNVPTRTQLYVEGSPYHALEMPATGNVTVMKVDGYDRPLVQIGMGNGLFMWAIVTPRPADEVALLKQVIDLTATGTEPDSGSSHVKLPAFSINRLVDLSWLKGLTLGSKFVDQAFQHFMVTADSGGIKRRPRRSPQCVAIDGGFTGFFTSTQWQLPFGIFYADPGCWQPYLRVV